MLKVTDFVELIWPGLRDRLRGRGFAVVDDVASDGLVVLTSGEINFYTKFANILVCCESDAEVEKAEQRTFIAFRYDWELLRYLEHAPSQFEGKYLVTGFFTGRIGLHACMKGWSLLSTPSSGITYLHQDPVGIARERAYYTLPCLIKNALVDATLDLVCDKSILYTKMKKYIPETEPLIGFKFRKGVYIAKPAGVGAYTGKGITIVRSANDLREAKKTIAKNKAWTGIISRYIDNPLLFRGRKFHVRVYMLVTSARTYSVFGRSHIFTAQLPHVPGKYEKAYTDSHGASTEEDWELERDFDGAQLLRERIEEVCAEIWNIIGDSIECYPESKYGYEVIAPDIMFDTDMQPWLLEVNRKIGLASDSKTPEKYAEFMFDFYDWVFRFGVEPFLT